MKHLNFTPLKSLMLKSVSKCSNYSQKLTSWVSNDQPCECARCGAMLGFLLPRRNGLETNGTENYRIVARIRFLSTQTNFSRGRDPDCLYTNFSRGQEPDFLYTDFAGPFLIRNCYEKWVMYSKILRCARLLLNNLIEFINNALFI